MRPLTLVLIMVLTSNIYLSAQNQIPIPESITGTDFSLTLQQGSVQFYDGQVTNTMGVNGNILGPTLIMQKGDFVNIEVLNQLDETTTIHWHGMHVSAGNDGGPHNTIAPSATWHPSFTVRDRAATYWYHPHLHEKTNEHVSKGIAGFIIVRDVDEAVLQLPRSYGVDDFPLVIQTKEFDADNQIVTPTNSDNVVLVNATIHPELDLPAQVVRLRLLNGSSQRVFNLGLSNNTEFYQIASDGGLLNQPNATTRLQLAPGERAELLLDLSGMTGSEIQLMSYASEFPNGIYGATNPGMMPMMTLNAYNPNPMNGNDFEILQILVTEQTVNPITTVPATLVTLNSIPESQADVTRSLIFTPETPGPNALNGKFLINGAGFDMNTINYTIPLDHTEIWSLTNQSPIAHPFHIHDVQFFVLDRDGVSPLASEAGRKDVILVKPMETLRFIAQFSDYADNEIPFMYHCHMLVHEDDGMMGQFLVVDETIGLEETKNTSTRVLVSPNPVTTDKRTIQSTNPPLHIIEVYSVNGSLLDKTVFPNGTNQADLDISSIASGVYIINASGANWHNSQKLIIK